MEENTNIPAEKEQNAEKMTRKHYTKQQNLMYTVISVILFLIIYFGGEKEIGRAHV